MKIPFGARFFSGSVRCGWPARGFSLIEVCLALGVASVSLISLMGLVSVGIVSNRTAMELTAANALSTSIISDLRGSSFPSAKSGDRMSPRFQIPIPSSSDPGGSSTTTLFFGDSGQRVGEVGKDAQVAGGVVPRYRATLQFHAPGTGIADKPQAKAASSVRMLITWPAMADPIASVSPTKYSGSYEAVIFLDRN